MESPKFTLYFDGACLPNPKGHITVAFILLCNGIKVAQSAAIIGRGTQSDSELAEYYALIEGLNVFLRLWLTPGATLTLHGDCLGMIKRLNGEWKLTRRTTLHEIAKYNIDYIRSKGVDVRLEWIAREHNAECDALAKKFREEEVPRTGNR